MRIIYVALLLSLFFVFPSYALAISDPGSVPNNRFGIHILQRSDIERAAELVNSSGGEWGYVTLVIQENDRDIKKWQEVFDELRRNRLIPIVRLATSPIGAIWRKPTADDASGWADFLGSLTWVTQNRYVVLFNEPNHAKEWQGKIAPGEYADVAKAFHTKLKDKSADFFVLPAGLDASAPNGRDTMDAIRFWQEMHKADSTIFSLFDGWTSHSYPNPEFSGDPADNGKQSIKGYLQELEAVKKLGLSQSARVFITETGWIHKEGKLENKEAFDAAALSSHFQKAYESAWNDDKIVAVTPFVLRYNDVPFDHFSWIDQNGNPYPFFDAVKAISKKTGEPKIINSFSFDKDPIPDKLLAGSVYDIEVFIKNTGQRIWEEGEITFKDIPHTPSPYLEPGQSGKITITLRTGEKEKKKTVTIEPLYKKSQIGEKVSKEISIEPPTSLRLLASRLPKIRKFNSADVTLLIYDGVRFIKEIKDVVFENGEAKVLAVHDLIPGHPYRFVLTFPYYLPVQTYAHLSVEETVVAFPPLLPVDLSGDGAFAINDVGIAIARPIKTFTLLWPFGF